MINAEGLRVLETLKEAVQKTDDMVYAYVTDFDGKIFTHTFEKGFPKALVPSSKKTITQDSPLINWYLLF